MCATGLLQCNSFKITIFIICENCYRSTYFFQWPWYQTNFLFCWKFFHWNELHCIELQILKCFTFLLFFFFLDIAIHLHVPTDFLMIFLFCERIEPIFHYYLYALLFALYCDVMNTEDIVYKICNTCFHRCFIIIMNCV